MACESGFANYYEHQYVQFAPRRTGYFRERFVLWISGRSRFILNPFERDGAVLSYEELSFYQAMEKIQSPIRILKSFSPLDALFKECTGKKSGCRLRV